MSTPLTTLFRTTSARSRRATTVVAAGGVAALCLGAAAPAYACRTGDGGVQPLSATTVSAASASGLPATDEAQQKPSADVLRTKVLGHIDALTARLAEARQKVTGSDRLTSEQQAAWLKRLDAAAAALAGLREQVAADTTSVEIWQDLRAFWKDHRGLMAVAGHRWHHTHRVRENHAAKDEKKRADVRRASFGDRWSIRDGDRAGWRGDHRSGERHGDNRREQRHRDWQTMTRHR
jgi:hypothetical protein